MLFTLLIKIEKGPDAPSAPANVSVFGDVIIPETGILHMFLDYSKKKRAGLKTERLQSNQLIYLFLTRCNMSMVLTGTIHLG